MYDSENPYFTDRIDLIEEMFFSHDLSVVAQVYEDDYPVGHLRVGEFKTELFKIEHKPRPCYQHTGWKNKEGYPVTNYLIRKTLDKSLRAHLINRWNAELYAFLDVPLPKAELKSNWRSKAWSWVKGVFA